MANRMLEGAYKDQTEITVTTGKDEDDNDSCDYQPIGNRPPILRDIDSPGYYQNISPLKALNLFNLFLFSFSNHFMKIKQKSEIRLFKNIQF